MTNYSRSSSFYSNSYDRYRERTNNSTLGKMQQQYWVTKHSVLQKLGKKEDEFIVASDAELDAKLELFRAIEETSLTLQKVIEMYQDKILALSQEENCLGRFLKEQGKLDKTRAGKMMAAAGKCMSYTAQQRLSLRVPLVRLHQEVETFRSRAIADTFVTVSQMEGHRTEYRGALHWMKDISQELDPDTFKQLDKFRKVQTQVRRSKTKFDKLKIDCLQKIDLLAASRCNMFSHALANYQNTLLNFWLKTSKTMATVAESFQGYQHYEFSMLKELSEPSRKLAEETNSTNDASLDEDIDKDRLIFFDEYHDDDDESDANKKSKSDTENGANSLIPKKDEKNKVKPNSSASSISKELSEALLDLDFAEISSSSPGKEPQINGNESTNKTENSTSSNKGVIDLLTDKSDIADEDKDDMTLLREILSIPNSSILEDNNFSWPKSFDQTEPENAFCPDWQSAFGPKPESGDGDNTKDFLPSQLLDLPPVVGGQILQPEASKVVSQVPPTTPPIPKRDAASGSVSKVKRKAPQPSSIPSKNKTDKGKDMSKWFNLFADLDPLSNPDAVGKSADDVSEEDRNC